LFVSFERLTAYAVRAAVNAAEELRVSAFQPMCFELPFSSDYLPGLAEERLRLSGKVDRVDGYVRGDTLFLRVIDYKTGKSGFSLNELYHGLSLQLFLYSMGISQMADELLKKSTGASMIMPAGILVLPLSDMIVKEQEKQGGFLQRSGIVTGGEELLNAMEPPPRRFLPEKPREDAFVSVSASEWERLSAHVDTLLIELAQEMASGTVKAEPANHKGQPACQNCPYQAACQFDLERGDKMKFYRKFSTAEIMEKLKT
jgi:ATP-dependent helicase/nuclease subunit B